MVLSHFQPSKQPNKDKNLGSAGFTLSLHLSKLISTTLKLCLESASFMVEGSASPFCGMSFYSFGYDKCIQTTLQTYPQRDSYYPIPILWEAKSNPSGTSAFLKNPCKAKADEYPQKENVLFRFWGTRLAQFQYQSTIYLALLCP